MVATTQSYRNSDVQASVGQGYDGVVRVSTGQFTGTGSLLWDGRVILTAAHVVENTLPDDLLIHFQTSSGDVVLDVMSYRVHPEYDASNNYDLALLFLDSSAPVDAERYSLYRESDELGQVFTLVGYGSYGVGIVGARYTQPDRWGDYDRFLAQNTFDATADELKFFLGTQMGWSPVEDLVLVADFDSGLLMNDLVGTVLSSPDVGVGMMEGLIAPGDSGGPAFLDGKIAGVASYIASLSYQGDEFDVNAVYPSSYGETAYWQRMSEVQQWVDLSIRAEYPDAPTKAEDVVLALNEGDVGTQWVYFFLEYNGERSWVDDLQVEYATRDGSAQSGLDYLSVEGVLNLYASETYAVIPVEIIGDLLPEDDETFYLDVFNPVGAVFPNNQTVLTAFRTILDDDGVL